MYDGREHVRIATLPGMWERTLTVGSAGSMFLAPLLPPTAILTSIRGDRALRRDGLARRVARRSAGAHRADACREHEYRVLLEHADAGAATVGLIGAQEREFFEAQLRECEKRRKVLIDVFERLGMGHTLPQAEGGCFVLLVSEAFVQMEP